MTCAHDVETFPVELHVFPDRHFPIEHKIAAATSVCRKCGEVLFSREDAQRLVAIVEENRAAFRRAGGAS